MCVSAGCVGCGTKYTSIVGLIDKARFEQRLGGVRYWGGVCRGREFMERKEHGQRTLGPAPAWCVEKLRGQWD